MKNKELLFNLLKLKDKGEIRFTVNGSGAVFLSERGSAQAIFLFQIEDENIDFDEKDTEEYYEEAINEPFRERFYKEKGLDNCSIMYCPNKIYQTEKDCRKIRFPCGEKHTRIVCLNHPVLEDYHDY